MKPDYIDPRETVALAAAMHDDRHLRVAIRFARADCDKTCRWLNIKPRARSRGRQASAAVDDSGARYVVGHAVFSEA